MYYAGLDVHKSFIYGVIIDDSGNVFREWKFPTIEQALELFFLNIPPTDLSAVVEACGIALPLYKYLGERCKVFKVAHPTQVKAIANARIKTDKIDAHTLAMLLKGDLIPECYVPSEDIRELREVSRHRASLVRLQTSIKNQVHSYLRRKGIRPTVDDVFTNKGLKYLHSLNEPPVDRLLRIYDSFQVPSKRSEKKSTDTQTEGRTFVC